VDKNKKIIFFTLVVFSISLFALFYFISPEDIVNKIGVRNGYVLVFLVSLFGGFSAGGFVYFASILVTLVAGGLDPLHVGLIAGISLSLGDLVMFYLGSKGRELIKGKWKERINKVTEICKKSKWLQKATPVFAYLYMGFSPFPNDIIILLLAAIKYPPKAMSIIIISADMTFAMILAFLGANLV